MRRLSPPRGDDRGTVALLIAAGMTALLVIAAMVLDFGLVRLDRQQVRQAMDSAVMAGLRAADDGRDKVFTQRAVCGALDFLRENEPTLSGLPSTLDCSSTSTAWQKTCNRSDPFNASSAVSWTGSVTSGNITTSVTAKMPYNLTEGGYHEETYASVASDTTTENGCDQLAVLVTRSVEPGLGSLATSSDMTSRLRSVGRVEITDGDQTPALLLLERFECGVLTVGSGGSPSRIKVYGSTHGPATIHADSEATAGACGSGSNAQLFQGKQTDGIVAYGATDGTSGIITSVATQLGRAANVVSDGTTNVYATTALTEATSGVQGGVLGRDPVTRRPVDERYLAGLRVVSRSAYAEWQKNHAAPAGYSQRYGCPSAADMTAMAAMTSVQSVYIDCPSSSGISVTGTIGAGKIYFHGYIKGSKIRMPNATEVYLDNTNDSGGRINNDALALGNNEGFCIRATVCDTLNVGTCSLTPTGTFSQARLVVRRGGFSTTGGLLRLCNTTVLLQGGQIGNGTDSSPGGCLTAPTSTTPPTTPTVPPTSTPCPGAPSGDAGNGLVGLSGETDWTPPNRYGDMVAAGMTRAQQQAAWTLGEDLALWTETYGTGSAFKMAGGGLLHVSGTFATFNAHPFTISGSGVQDLSNAQFVTRSFAVDGGATLTMKSYDDAIAVPDLGPFLLVR